MRSKEGSPVNLLDRKPDETYTKPETHANP